MKITLDEKDDTRARELLAWLQRRGYNAKEERVTTSKKKKKG